MRAPTRSTATALLAAAGLAALVRGTAAEEAPSPAATAASITLDLPAGFRPAARPGTFASDALETTVETRLLPATAYAELAPRLDTGLLAGQGLEEIVRGRLARPEPYAYAVGRLATGEEVYTAFTLLFPADEATPLVVIKVPARFLVEGRISRAEVERWLASARLGAATAAP